MPSPTVECGFVNFTFNIPKTSCFFNYTQQIYYRYESSLSSYKLFIYHSCFTMRVSQCWTDPCLCTKLAIYLFCFTITSFQQYRHSITAVSYLNLGPGYFWVLFTSPKTFYACNQQLPNFRGEGYFFYIKNQINQAAVQTQDLQVGSLPL